MLTLNVTMVTNFIQYFYATVRYFVSAR